MSDEEFQNNLQAIEEGKINFSEDEQTIISAWIAKLSEPQETEDENGVRNEYARTLARLTTQEKRLLPPFTEMPDAGDLPPLSSPSSPQPTTSNKKYSIPIWKMPCSNTTSRRQGSLSPKPTRRRQRSIPMVTSNENEFEDFEEMARVIAQSKGQTFPEFVMTISRHTADSGQALRSAMKSEITSFKEYVDRILTRRIKDMTKVLDQEHNSEFQKIKKDIDKWELELSHCKRRIREMLPYFDMDEYKMDRAYLRKIYTVDTPGSAEMDSIQRYVEDLATATQQYLRAGVKLIKCNESVARNIEGIRSKIMNLESSETMRQQAHIQEMNCEIAEYQKLKDERDLLHKEIMDLLKELQLGES